MRRFVPLLAVLLGSVVLTSCESGPNIPTASAPSAIPGVQLLDGRHNGNPYFFFLPPTVLSAPGPFTGTFDGTVNAIARVCVGASACTHGAASMVAEFTKTGGTGGGAATRVTVLSLL